MTLNTMKISILLLDSLALDEVWNDLSGEGIEATVFSDFDRFLQRLPGLDTKAVVAVMNLSRPDGTSVPRLCHAYRPEIPVLVICPPPAVEEVVAVMRAGAVDVLESLASTDRLVASIHRVTQADADVCERERAVELGKLTPREIEILKLLVDGHQNKVVAHKLGISPRTVEVHRSRMSKRLGLKSFAELVRFAINNRLFED